MKLILIKTAVSQSWIMGEMSENDCINYIRWAESTLNGTRYISIKNPAQIDMIPVPTQNALGQVNLGVAIIITPMETTNLQGVIAAPLYHRIFNLPEDKEEIIVKHYLENMPKPPIFA